MRDTTRVLTMLVAGAVASAAWTVTAVPHAAAATATSTTLTSNANPATVGQAVTLTATVAGDTPTGRVDFLELGSVIGSADLAGGVATLVVNSFTAGDHALTAQYVGDADDDPSSGTLTQTVVAPPPPTTPPPPPAPQPTVKKPTVHLTTSAKKASVGDKVLLKWRSKRADRATASGDWGGAQRPKGKAQIRITERGKHVFKLTVENAAGRSTATVKIVATRKAKELELVVTEELVLVGTEVDVDADGLAKGEVYTVRLAGKPVLTGKADKRGDVHRSFRLARTAPEGVLALTITGSNPGRVGEAELSVIKPKELDVEVEAEEVARKAEQTVSVTGLLPGEEVTVTYLGEKVATGKADVDGHFDYTFEVGRKSGEKTVRVTGAVPTRTGEATFTITDPTPPGGNPHVRLGRVV